MNERHEIKHRISLADYFILRQRLRAVLYPDEHAGPDGSYTVRSLYFDTPDNRALREKIDGVSCRDKYRIRCYNYDTTCIHLEKKSKRKNLCIKKSMDLSEIEVQSLIDGDYNWLENRKEPLAQELHRKILQENLRPRTIVDYIRDPFVYPAGNVRVTLDHHIRTGLTSTDFLNPDCVTIPADRETILLEIKWDDYLPDIVRDIVRLPGRQTTAYSKYAACRIFE